MTKKATKRNKVNSQPQPQTQTLVLDQPANLDEMKALFNTFLECCVGNNEPGASIIITKENGKTTIARRVGETVTKAVTVVKTVVEKTVAKTRSMLRTAWNWTISRLKTVCKFVKESAVKTKDYVLCKAAQLLLAGIIAFYMAKFVVRNTYRKTKAALINGYRWCKSKTLQLAAWTVCQWKALKAWSIATWIQAKPYAKQAGRIAAVTAVLYVFATATVLVTCLAVAVLGLSAYDRACESLVNTTNLKSALTGKKKDVSSPLQKSLLGV